MLQYIKSHSILVNTDKENHSLSPCMCHYSHRDMKHIHLILIKAYKLRVLFFRTLIPTTLITCRSDKTRITLTCKWIRCIRYTSTMLITDIRRAYYIKNEEKYQLDLRYILWAFVKLVRNEKRRRILMNMKNDVKLGIDVIVERNNLI